MAKHIHIHVGKAKATDAVYNLRETNGTSWGNYSASSGAEAKELLKRDIKKDPSKFMGIKFLTNGDPDLSQVRVILDTQDATNHLGEKEYYTYHRWKEAVKAAYPNARFEGDQDMYNAVPGGEWDGEKGVVYAKKTGDASTAGDFNSGLNVNLKPAISNARLPSNPSESDIDRSIGVLQRAKSDIDGLLVILNALKRQF